MEFYQYLIQWYNYSNVYNRLTSLEPVARPDASSSVIHHIEYECAYVIFSRLDWTKSVYYNCSTHPVKWTHYPYLANVNILVARLKYTEYIRVSISSSIDRLYTSIHCIYSIYTSIVLFDKFSMRLLLIFCELCHRSAGIALHQCEQSFANSSFWRCPMRRTGCRHIVGRRGMFIL